MITKVPFYLHLTEILSGKNWTTGDDAEKNRRMSLALLNSMLPTLANIITDQDNSVRSTVILTPTAKESVAVCAYIVNQMRQSGHTANQLNLIKLVDNKRHVRIVDDAGVHIVSYHNAKRLLLSCDKLITYYPIAVSDLNAFYRSTRMLVLLDPVNKTDNVYAEYIEMVSNRRTGVRK